MTLTHELLSISTEGFHRIAYSEWGKHSFDYPTIICAHGLLRNRRDFDALANYLNQHKRHVICPDFVGRGNSAWLNNAKHYTFEQYITDMTVLIARATSPQIDWIGTSLGGLVGMMMAALPNSPIRRLVLNDIGPQIPMHGLRRLAKYAFQHQEFANRDEAKQYYQTIYADFGISDEMSWNKFIDDSIHQLSSGKYAPNHDPNIAQHKPAPQFLFELLHHPHKALEGILFDIDMWTTWEKIKCPVLIVHGRHSDILLPEYITKMQTTHPNTDVLEIEQAGHAPSLLAPFEHEAITNWLGITGVPTKS